MGIVEDAGVILVIVAGVAVRQTSCVPLIVPAFKSNTIICNVVLIEHVASPPG